MVALIQFIDMKQTICVICQKVEKNESFCDFGRSSRRRDMRDFRFEQISLSEKGDDQGGDSVNA